MCLGDKRKKKNLITGQYVQTLNGPTFSNDECRGGSITGLTFPVIAAAVPRCD